MLRSIARAAWIGALVFGALHVGLVLFGKRPLRPSWDVIAEWAFMSIALGAVFGRSQWEEKEKDYQESNDESEKH